MSFHSQAGCTSLQAIGKHLPNDQKGIAMRDKLVKPVLILGAGKSGTIFLGEFMQEPEIEISGICDVNPDAPGMLIAQHYGIPTFTDVREALQACKNSMVFNLTGDESLSLIACDIVGPSAILGGDEVFTIWKLLEHLKEMQKELTRSQSYLNAVVNYANDGIVTIDATGTIVAVNPSINRIFGYEEGELIGQRVNVLMPASYASEHDRYIQNYFETGISKLIGIPRELTGVRKDGTEFPIEISLSTMDVQHSKYFIGIIRDATERVEYLQHVSRLALYDHLTGLPNRIMFYDRLEQSMLHGKRYKMNFALLFIDLDGFKQINDMEGHGAGDEVLKTIGKLLQSCIRESDTLARIGGDEFVIILPTLSNDDDLIRVVEKIHAELAGHRFDFGNRHYSVSASIGASRFPQDGDSCDLLVKKADTAMYQAKRAGKGRLCLDDKMFELGKA